MSLAGAEWFWSTNLRRPNCECAKAPDAGVTNAQPVEHRDEWGSRFGYRVEEVKGLGTKVRQPASTYQPRSGFERYNVLRDHS